jgi:hypothetical protein
VHCVAALATLATLAAEHAARVVHHAVRGVVGHRTAAERMHGDRAVVEEARGDRIAHVVAAQRRRGRFERFFDGRVDGLLARVGPGNARAALFHADFAALVVVSHHEVGLRVAHGAVVRPAQHALREAGGGAQFGRSVGGCIGCVGCIERVRHRHALGRGRDAEHAHHRLADGRSERPFLDHVAVPHVRRVALVDDARDGRSHGRHHAGRLRAPAHAVDFVVRIEGEGEHVAVAREVPAHQRRERQARGLRAQQDRRGAERAGGEDHHVGGQEEVGRAVAFASQVHELIAHLPGLRLVVACHRMHADAREDLRAVRDGVGQVVHVRRVLRAVVATRVAVAAADAARLFHARRVLACGEGHGDGRPVERLFHAERGGRLLQRVELGQAGEVGGHGRRLQHGRGALVTRGHAEAVFAQRGGPARVVPEPRLGMQRDIRVDERRAAQPAAHHHVDLGIHVHFDERERRTDLPGRRVVLHLREPFERRGRELAGHELAAPLQHADAALRARHAACGDGAAVARSDHDDFVVRLERVDCTRQTIHGHAVTSCC